MLCWHKLTSHFFTYPCCGGTVSDREATSHLVPANQTHNRHSPNFNCSVSLWEYTNARMVASSKWAQIQFKVDSGFTPVASPQVKSLHAVTGEHARPFIWLADSKLVLENCILLTALPSFPAFTKLSVLKLAHCFFQLLPLHSYELLTELQVQKSAR